jgi:hypothetical protein
MEATSGEVSRRKPMMPPITITAQPGLFRLSLVKFALVERDELDDGQTDWLKASHFSSDLGGDRDKQDRIYAAALLFVAFSVKSFSACVKRLYCSRCRRDHEC